MGLGRRRSGKRADERAEEAPAAERVAVAERAPAGETGTAADRADAVEPARPAGASALWSDGLGRAGTRS
ncbi:MAG: hypothetical protein ACI38P_16635, partial [Cellulosimicrobium funkei]